MEKSNEFFVKETGQLVRCLYDSRDRDTFEVEVHGVHRTSFNVWIWNPSRGPSKRFSEDWLRTEDGQDFQKFMDENDFEPDEGDLE